MSDAAPERPDPPQQLPHNTPPYVLDIQTPLCDVEDAQREICARMPRHPDPERVLQVGYLVTGRGVRGIEAAVIRVMCSAPSARVAAEVDAWHPYTAAHAEQIMHRVGTTEAKAAAEAARFP